LRRRLDALRPAKHVFAIGIASLEAEELIAAA